MFKVYLIHLPLALEGGSIKESYCCLQWFLSLRSGLEKPLLAGYRCSCHLSILVLTPS